MDFRGGNSQTREASERNTLVFVDFYLETSVMLNLKRNKKNEVTKNWSLDYMLSGPWNV